MPPPYNPVGRCVYCGSTIYSADEPLRKLGEEHIIPLQLRGTLVLPEASCKDCETLTSGIETHVTPLYHPGRYHLGITGRKARKQKTHIPALIGRKGMKTKLKKSDHPGTMQGFLFEFPGILLGLPPGGKIAGKVQISEVNPDFKDRLRRLGFPIHWNLGNGVSAETFRRFLAKIGHAFTAAEIGLGNFQPLLIDAIKGTAPDSLPWLTGSPAESDIGRASVEHEIGFVDIDPSFWVVRIRIFANCGLSPHYVVAGRKE